jgi:hypothetical protein
MPPISEPLFIIDVETRETLYYNPYSGQYTRSRSYAERMQRNYLRGISRQEARGHAPAANTTEASTRRERFLQRYQIGYNRWRRWQRRYIREINQLAWKDGPRTLQIDENGQRADPRIFLIDALAVKQLFDSGFRDPVYPNVLTWDDWFEERLKERLYALQQYHDNHNPQPGRQQWQTHAGTWFGQFASATGPPIELWYYH